jgi:hypothetical protein
LDYLEIVLLEVVQELDVVMFMVALLLLILNVVNLADLEVISSMEELIFQQNVLHQEEEVEVTNFIEEEIITTEMTTEMITEEDGGN